MLDTIEKARIILSANQEASINIECLIDDYDLSRSLKRQEFEEIIAPNIQQLVDLISETIKESGLKTSEIYSVEMVGCGTRIPAIMDASMKAFDKQQIARTLHSDEAVARGCSLMAAMLLPTFHTSKFEMDECNGIPVDITWSVHDGVHKTKTLFPVKSNYPTVKSLTFDN